MCGGPRGRFNNNNVIIIIIFIIPMAMMGLFLASSVSQS
jgi:hypothetical protein